MEIKAAVLYGVGEKLKVESLELAPPQAGEVLVKMKAAGVCDTRQRAPLGIPNTRFPKL